MKKKSSLKKNSGFNNKWKLLFVGIIIFAITSFFYYRKQTHLSDITEKQLISMLHKGEVKRVVLMKHDNYVKIQLTPTAFYERKYKKMDEGLKHVNPEDTHYTLKILHPAIFHDNWKEIQASIAPEHQLDYDIDDSVGFTEGMGGNFSFFIFLLLMLSMFGGTFLKGRGNIFSIGNSKASHFDKDTHVNVTFDDVKGVPEAKQEIQEIVDFLKHPEKYTRLGGRMTRGVLLVGPPGCGKTLLAKAVAGEAGVPFFFLSGADFTEMFVGVGASRVRKLFQEAKKNAPCIIFIDEIDAVGKSRSKRSVSYNEEGANTLNALLSAMDGFDSDTHVIVLAATNLPDVLDDALKRPGRFDRQVYVDKPTIKGREEIFAHYIKNLRKVSPKVSVKQLAKETPGFTGADISSITNLASLIAARKNKKQIDMQDFTEAIERVKFGLERKDKLIEEKEKNIVAYHEAGHAVTSHFLKYADPLVKVSIIPRGIAALGYAQYLPKERYIYQKHEMIDRIGTLLGGMVSEMIFFEVSSTGAQNDLEVATNIAYNMYAVYGMSKEVGLVSFPQIRYENSFTKPYSEATAQIIDKSVRELIDQQYQRILALLKDKKAIVEVVAQKLLEKEVLYPEELQELIDQQESSKATVAVIEEKVEEDKKK